VVDGGPRADTFSTRSQGRVVVFTIRRLSFISRSIHYTFICIEHDVVFFLFYWPRVCTRTVVSFIETCLLFDESRCMDGEK